MLFRPLFFFFCVVLMAGAAQAHDYQIAQLHIDHPWARALPPVVPTGAAYLRIENRGDSSDSLIDASTPIAAKVEVHEHVHVDGLMKMQKADQVVVAPGDSIAFEPGSYHFMLFGLKQPLVADEAFPLTLVFQNAGSIEVQVMITETAPSPTVDGGHQGHHH